MSHMKNTCRTYFAIKGDFVVKQIATLLKVSPSKSWNKTDIRKADNKPYGFSYMEICENKVYDPYVDKMMEITIKPLIDKVDLLNKIREQYNVEFYLVVVPEVVVDNIAPCLAPSIEVMEFCVKTKTKIDCDLYIYNK